MVSRLSAAVVFLNRTTVHSFHILEPKLTHSRVLVGREVLVGVCVITDTLSVLCTCILPRSSLHMTLLRLISVDDARSKF